jgi:hypothetical protein
MCRYDDDFEWYVGGEGTETAEGDRTCEDCGRLIPAGEEHTWIVEEPVDDGWDNEVLFVAIQPGKRWISAGDPFIVIPEDDIDVWEALGFTVCDFNRRDLYPGPPQYHYCCNHCRAADLWLREVCDQHVVFVTTIDLEQHRHEYTDDQLGPDFVTLETLSRQRWRSKLTGELIPVPVIHLLAKKAAVHALAGGMIA